MTAISYGALTAGITLGWLAVRAAVCLRAGRFRWRRELQLLLVYICLVVVARFTFFPFEMPEGRVQPLLLDPAQVYPFRINLTPLVHLMAYPEARSAWLNLIGNTAMFIPVGVVWPAMFRELRAPLRGLAAGMGFSLCIELLQLPFFDRVSDVDDLILNGLGYAIGYGLYSLVHRWMKRRT